VKSTADWAKWSGKTTLIRMLAAAEEPTTGEIYINGDRLLRDQSNSTLRRRLGYLPDDFPLLKISLGLPGLLCAAVSLTRSASQSTPAEVLELVQLTNKRNSDCHSRGV